MGDGLPAASLRALLSLLKPQRRKPSDREKQEIRDRQHNLCAECSCELTKVEYHHEIPLANAVARQTLVAVCPECHQVLTMSQGPKDDNPLESCFEKSVYEQYVRSPKTRAMVYSPYAHGENRGSPLTLDLVRCRFNALYNCVFEIPIFSQLDEIVEAPKTLCDLSFVSKPVKWTSSTLIENMPFQGNGWYSKIAVQYMLHRKIIGFDHITHGLQATAHIAKDLMQRTDRTHVYPGGLSVDGQKYVRGRNEVH